MTKKAHDLRNHKNLRLTIAGSMKDTVILQRPIKVINAQERDEKPDEDENKNYIGESQKKTKTTKGECKSSTPVPFFKLFKYSTACEKCLMVLGTLTAIVTGVAIPTNIYIFGKLVGDMVKAQLAIIGGNVSLAENITIPDGLAAENTSAATNTSTDFIMDAVTKFAIGNCIIGSILLAFSYIGIMLFNYTALKQSFRVRTMYLRSVLHQDIAWYDVSKSGEVASRLTEDVIKFEDGIGEKVPMFLHNLFAFIGSIALAFGIGWKLTLVCMATVPIMTIVLAFIVRVSSVLTRREVEVYAVAGSIAEEVLAGIRTVAAFAGQRKELARYTGSLDKTYGNNAKKGLLSGVGLGVLWLSMYCSYALSFWYGVTLILDERHLPHELQTYNATSMTTVFFSIMMGAMSLGAVTPFVEAFGVSKAASSKVFSIIERKPAIDSLSDNGEKPTDVRGSIEFKSVSFEYPSRSEVKVLKSLSFTVKKGETVALVGSSGCGKSTCIQLLQRFYDPKDGQIFIDNYDLKDLNVKWLRSCLGVVGQEPVLFNTTVAENIRYGDLYAPMEKIIQAAKEANAHDFIMKLPNKYDTLVGEKGTQISGGQKQRIAIARALIRNPHILLLDEATSALDTRSESKVQAALDKAHKGRTTIIVAHRLSTIRNADKIIVISKGSVVEEGKHDYLMQLKGHYHSLVTAQVSIVPTGGQSNDTGNQVDEDEEMELIRQKTETIEKSRSDEPSVSTWRILQLNKQEWLFNVIACITSIVTGFSMPLFSILFGDIIGVLSRPNPDDVRSETNVYSLYFVITGILIGSTSFIQVYLFRIAGERLTMRLRGHLFEAMLRQEVGWYDEPANGTGALCSKLSTDAAAVQGAIGQRIGTIFQSCSTIALSVGLALYYEWRLGLVGMTFIPLIMVVTYAQGLLFRQETLNYHNSLEVSTKIAVEAVSNVRTVIGLCREDTFFQSYVNSMVPSLNLGVRNTHFRGLVFGMARAVSYFAYAACMYYGGYLMKNDGLFYATVFKVSQALIMGTVMVANASAFAPNLQKGLIAAEQIINLIERKPAIEDPDSASNDNWVSQAKVDYKQVSFEYPTRPGVAVLNQLQLNIPSGLTVALIGASGCGKSTIIQLLERFYDPNSGVIELSETDIRSATQSELRKQLGLVSQEPTLFARTIAENIAYGDNDRDVPMAEIIDVAKKANIHNFVSSLPLGYETTLGDRGTQLSGGQKQRIAIARALLRNPKVLLLDEATSALDSESEKVVQAALDEAKAGRTCILIAHRLSTVKDADKICVVDRGTVAESGTHNELIETKGMYYELLCLQN
ncbi:ATP-dependent translocase ABCB1-like [Phymastichus coffea]|uniref:ATP-dependent translocase ABCB1-like n=1 Tax=Phymastichus coffea TaxID=108790 RepID=UPI00273C8CDC|nr:ATP-dependent translocase ABCB1-like [Phymastichus coffea]